MRRCQAQTPDKYKFIEYHKLEVQSEDLLAVLGFVDRETYAGIDDPC